MNITLDSTVLIVSDFPKMKRFYTKVLEQKIKHDFGNCIVLEKGLALWQLKKEYPLSVKLGSVYSKEGNRNIEICYITENIDKAYSDLLKEEVKFLHHIEMESWGQKTIRFFDPENNLIEIGESIPCFVRRLYTEGMTMPEVSNKTGIEIDTVNRMINLT